MTNPYAKPKRAAVKAKPTKVQPPRYGAAKAEFLLKTRRQTSDDPNVLKGIDWRRIPYSSTFLSFACNKKVSVDSFYVKDISAWLPYIVVPNYIPTCHRCCSKAGVDVGRFRWVKHPKTLCDVKTHRYLDSVYCWCIPCNNDFLAWHDAVLESDAEEIFSVLNFRLSNRVAVDEELHSFIVAHGTDTTALTHQRLKSLHTDHWLNFATIYHCAVLAKRVKAIPKRGRIDSMLTDKPETANQKRRKSLRWDYTTLKRKVDSLQSAFNADVNFMSIVHRKENRNSIGESFPGIGKGKCQTLISKGIKTAKELLIYDRDDPAIKHTWKYIVQKHYDDLETKLN